MIYELIIRDVDYDKLSILQKTASHMYLTENKIIEYDKKNCTHLFFEANAEGQHVICSDCGRIMENP